MTVFVEKTVKAPMINLISIISEVQLMKEWVPNMIRSDLIGEISHFRKLVILESKMVWPM